jgi:hypothetical protein
MYNWYILCSFGKFFPVLVSCAMKNLATLPKSSHVNLCRSRNKGVKASFTWVFFHTPVTLLFATYTVLQILS